MTTSDKMEKYLNKKTTYKPVNTIDNVFAKALDNAKKDQAKYKKKIDKMLIRDAEGYIHEFIDVQIVESEDGVGTMTYTAMHPRYRYGKNIKCPFCNKNIDLKKLDEK